MTDSSRVRVYMACSVDGFIAGPDNDLAWLTEDRAHPGTLAEDADGLGFVVFIEQVGAILMGRTTYDVVVAMGEWPYGETPVLVATRRPLDPVNETVSARSGDIAELISEAKKLAGDKDVYLDGGALIQQALNAGQVDEIVATYIPVLLGSGVRLFDGLTSRTNLRFTSRAMLEGGMLQVTAKVVR
ncbi:MAG: dihydrofolate reductase family protein [Sandaracinaceae bacterium]